MSADLKRGIGGLIVIIAFIFAVRTARHANLFNPNPSIHGIFNTTGGIEVNDNVRINGLLIGKVLKLEPSDQKISRIKITMKIDRDLNIPTNSVAHISKSAIEPAIIIIERGDAKTYLKNNDIINTKEADGALENLQAQAKPLAHKIQNITDSVAQLLLQYNTKINAKRQADMRKSVNEFSQQMKRYAGMAHRSHYQSMPFLERLKATSETYVAKQKEINRMIAGANKKISALHEIQPGRKADSLHQAIASINRQIRAFNTGSQQNITGSRNAYNRLNEGLLNTEIMLDDIRLQPERSLYYPVLGKSSKAPEKTEPRSTTIRRKRNAAYNERQQLQYNTQ